ncbi:serine/threonine-protein kinase [Actinomadura gamaensis]|uniref:Serine/threonine-protein kinase n=1 Tax=Actinomadura gamaensis TaxID=1763541 RepID=A0ABV9U0K5_9ACTN
MGRREAPVPEGPLHDFALGLRALRAKAPGSPAYRQLAKTACYSASVLSMAASGRALPTWDVTRAYVQACGGDTEEWHAIWTRLNDTLRSTHPELVTAQVADKAREGTRETTRNAAQETARDAAAPRPDGTAPQHGRVPLSESGTVSADDRTGSSGRTDRPDRSAARRTATADDRTAAVAPLMRSDPASIGPFRLLGRLGSGSMGVVYLGATRTGRPVAVKVVRAHVAEDSHFRRRFAAEVAAARRVQGPCTPAVTDADPDAEPPWMATAYVRGPALSDVVEERGPLPAEAVLALAAGTAEALGSIHAAGVLHRDLKPSNVLLDGDGPKVIDFGVAATADASRLTQTGARVGTVPFMAPEQAEGRPLTGAADVFALGSLLAYAATGHPPFGDGGAGEVLYRVVHADPDLSGLDGGGEADRRLRELILRCLAKDPDRRPTPQEVVDAATAALPDGVPASLPHPGTTARDEQVAALLSPAHRRNRVPARRLLVAAAAVIALGIAAGIAVLLLGGPRHTHDRGTPTSRTATPSSGLAHARSSYAPVYRDRRLELPDYNFYIDLDAGTVVEGHGGWTMSSNAGGDGHGAFELPAATDAYVPAPGGASLTADACAAGLASAPTRLPTLDGDTILRFPRVPPGSSFCLRSRPTGRLAVIRVIDTDDGDYGAKLAIDAYERS